MVVKLRFTARAVGDLENIRAYLVARNPRGAERVRAHIELTIDRLANFPELGPATDEPSVRVLPLTRYPYLIYYSLVGDDLVILHIRQAARKPVDPSGLKE
jgi:plasmid stabilization system protein ParE